MRKFIAVLMVFTVFLSLFGCGKKEKPENANAPYTSTENKIEDENLKPQRGGYITVYSYKPDTLCPLISKNRANVRMLNIVYDSLFSVDGNMNINPVLAESILNMENNLKFRVELKKNVRFHNGTPLTANDVVFSVNTIKANPESIYAYNVYQIKDVEAVGEHTVEFTLFKPLARFAALLEFPIIKSQDEPIDALSFQPVGTGGFIFENRNEGNLFHLVRNENWWGGEVYLDSVKVKLLPDKDTAMYAFSLGELSVCPAENEDWGKFVDAQSAEFLKYSQGNYHFLGFNHLNGLLSQTEVRQAISSVLDREEVLKSGVMDFGVPVNMPLKKQWGLLEKLSDGKSDLNNARKVLEENGWKIKNGVYQKEVNRKTQSLSFEILINEESYKKEHFANIIAQELTDFGISAKVKKVPFESYNGLVSLKNYDMFIGSMELTQELDLSFMFGAGNMFNLDDEELYFAHSDMQKSADSEEFRQRLEKLESLFNEKNPLYGIGFDDNILLYKKEVKGKLSPTKTDIYNGIESVFVKNK